MRSFRLPKIVGLRTTHQTNLPIWDNYMVQLGLSHHLYVLIIDYPTHDCKIFEQSFMGYLSC